MLTDDRKGLPRELVLTGSDRCDQGNRIAQLEGGVQALRAAVDDLTSNGAYRVMTGLAWDLEAWFARPVPVHPSHTGRHQEPKRRPPRREFQRFVSALILMPCPIVRGGQRL